jgi:hypothetical protein
VRLAGWNDEHVTGQQCPDRALLDARTSWDANGERREIVCDARSMMGAAAVDARPLGKDRCRPAGLIIDENSRP